MINDNIIFVTNICFVYLIFDLKSIVRSGWECVMHPSPLCPLCVSLNSLLLFSTIRRCGWSELLIKNL